MFVVHLLIIFILLLILFFYQGMSIAPKEKSSIAPFSMSKSEPARNLIKPLFLTMTVPPFCTTSLAFKILPPSTSSTAPERTITEKVLFSTIVLPAGISNRPDCNTTFPQGDSPSHTSLEFISVGWQTVGKYSFVFCGFPRLTPHYMAVGTPSVFQTYNSCSLPAINSLLPSLSISATQGVSKNFSSDIIGNPIISLPSLCKA